MNEEVYSHYLGVPGEGSLSRQEVAVLVILLDPVLPEAFITSAFLVTRASTDGQVRIESYLLLAADPIDAMLISLTRLQIPQKQGL